MKEFTITQGPPRRMTPTEVEAFERIPIMASWHCPHCQLVVAGDGIQSVIEAHQLACGGGEG